VGGVPVTVLRAGIVVGDQGLSWEITRQLVEHLPAMITPRWVHTRTQPIAVDDVIRYLIGVLGHPDALGRVFEIGRPEILRYSTMLKRVAEIEHRPLPIIPVPLLSPRLSSLWLSLVTDVDTPAGRTLVDSMTTEERRATPRPAGAATHPPDLVHIDGDATATDLQVGRARSSRAS
jgi:uncharacterized protein YbjT (DUF2867 family)